MVRVNQIAGCANLNFQFLNLAVRSLTVCCLSGWVAIGFQIPVHAQGATNRYDRLIEPAPTPFGKPLPSQAAPTREINYQQPQPAFATPTVPAIPTVPVNPTTGRYLEANANRYLVLVNSNSPAILEQVRATVEPNAFFKRFPSGQTVIQTGLFYDAPNAEDRAAQLQQAGFGGVEIATIPGSQPFGTPVAAPNYSSPGVLEATPYGTGTPYTRGTAALPPSFITPTAIARSNAYFVVIPGRTQDLPMIAEQVIRLGAEANSVFERVVPRGPHVAVGPFTERGPAETWTNYLRDFGLDARVYYGR